MRYLLQMKTFHECIKIPWARAFLSCNVVNGLALCQNVLGTEFYFAQKELFSYANMIFSQNIALTVTYAYHNFQELRGRTIIKQHLPTIFVLTFQLLMETWFQGVHFL